MPSQEELAHAPGGKDPSVNVRTKQGGRRLALRGLSALVLLSVACSHVVPTEVRHEGSAEGSRASGQQGGTGTRARGEEATAPGPAPKSEAHADRAALAPAGTVAAGVASKSTATAEVEARDFGMTGLVASGTGAGLGGIGTGGGGLPGAKRASALASAQGYGSGHGRLGGAATVRPSAPTALQQVGPRDPEFNTEAYKGVHDNPFRLVTEAPLSTFSVDVDTASYSNMRRFVQEGRLPPADAIRVEEWINYFGYEDAPPAAGEPVAVASELTDCPWAADHKLLRIALSTQPIAQDQVPPRNLVFLVDVSGSMQPANKLPLLKRGLAMLARQLRPADTLSIVVYAGASGVALPPTSGAEQSKILASLESLESGGSTNGAEGIELAYRLAERQMKRGGINRVILATDGDFNVGVTSEGELERLIVEKRKTGVFLTVRGFGEGNVKDSTMEMLADKGNGNYAYVDSLAEARKVLVHEAGATLVTVAQDVKLQLEFNPAHVRSYRLVGYENRVLADQDFNDDTKDAGDMGAGHHVTAFYEIVPGSARSPVEGPAVDPLRYQTPRAPGAASASDELLTVKIRYKAPGGTQSLLLSRPVLDRALPFVSTSDSFRFGAAVAEYALALRGAPGVGVQHLARARALASGAVGADPRGERREFIALMDRASQLPRP
jgi:Ca-activated chloride channel family protein